MSPNLSILLLLSSSCLHILASSYPPPETSGDKDNETFFTDCPSKRCSPEGPEIRFPFGLNNTHQSFCGLKGFELSCLGNETLLHLPFSGDFYIRKIDYLNNFVSIIDKNDTCPLRSLLNINFSSSVFNFTESASDFIIMSCPKSTTVNTNHGEIIGPIDCLSSDGNPAFVNPHGKYVNPYDLPLNCPIIKRGRIEVNVLFNDNYMYAYNMMEMLLKTREIVVGWNGSESCTNCEMKGNHCGLNRARNGTICRHIVVPSSHSHAPLIIGTSMGGAIILLSILLIVLYLYRKSEQQKKTELMVERFLTNYKTFNPTRYTFADIKKMTNKFKHKLGQGGFGCVYKGKLHNGFLVAVKMLEISNGNGANFVNEVATIGRIHHVNVVRLLGFCSERTRCALIYEFMPNGSLEKFILAKEGNTIHRPFTWEKMQEIAIGIARGIEYLHQGCDQRILHFDIKPHNVLLDHNFQPRISDFGLAKLCSKDQSIVSMTAARGTTGYIAPELFSRNFGTVSYKSDVYSFGMLMLEIVGGRKNLDITVENHSQIYFPEWIYEQLIQGKNLELLTQIEGDDEIMKKFAIIALWCIQWNPVDRPSMTLVVRMLEGDLQSLKIPPKPFFLLVILRTVQPYSMVKCLLFMYNNKMNTSVVVGDIQAM